MDGVRFADLTGWKASGNRYHRTPEPTWSEHVHHGACITTAIHRAKEWGDLETAARLSLQLKEIRERKATEGLPEGDRPSSPSSPSTLKKEQTSVVVVPEQTAGAADDDGSRPYRPTTCPVCTKPTLYLGQEGDHRFCGTQRGGCGLRFGLNEPAAIEALVAEAAAHGLAAYSDTREAWHRSLSCGTGVDVLLERIRRGDPLPGYRPPL